MIKTSVNQRKKTLFLSNISQKYYFFLKHFSNNGSNEDVPLLQQRQALHFLMFKLKANTKANEPLLS